MKHYILEISKRNGIKYDYFIKFTKGAISGAYYELLNKSCVSYDDLDKEITIERLQYLLRRAGTEYILKEED